MGKKGDEGPSTQTSGYNYFVGMHLIACHGIVDAVRQIMVGQHKVWQGNVRESKPIFVNRPKEFGKRGGVKCSVDAEFGEEDQDQNDYLVEQLGQKNVPTYRGLMGFVLNQVYVGKSPTIDPWSFLIERTNTFDKWYSNISAIMQVENMREFGSYEISGVRRTGLSG
ncbi:MAG: hypothetical protein ACOCQD_03530 [archaeon]